MIQTTSEMQEHKHEINILSEEEIRNVVREECRTIIDTVLNENNIKEYNNIVEAILNKLKSI